MCMYVYLRIYYAYRVVPWHIYLVLLKWCLHREVGNVGVDKGHVIGILRIRNSS